MITPLSGTCGSGADFAVRFSIAALAQNAGSISNRHPPLSWLAPAFCGPGARFLTESVANFFGPARPGTLFGKPALECRSFVLSHAEEHGAIGADDAVEFQTVRKVRLPDHSGGQGLTADKIEQLLAVPDAHPPWANVMPCLRY